MAGAIPFFSGLEAARMTEEELFGGTEAGGTDLDDTWTWDGAAWTQHVVVGPSARSHHAMATY